MKEKILRDERAPFENCPIGFWMGSCSHFCPHCFQPIVLCDCSIKRKGEKKEVEKCPE